MVTSGAPEKEKYSFSKLSSWHTCTLGFKYRYIDDDPGISNAFAEYGTLIHSIMERYAKGELELYELADVFEWEFGGSITFKFPWNKFCVLKDKYYEQGLAFFKSFRGYEKLKILGVEQKFSTDIDDWRFMGIIDLLFETPDGKLVIRDYKSKAEFKHPEEQKKYARQLYLYAMYVKEKYGRYPDELQFLMFRKQRLVKIQFELEAFEEAQQWAKDTVADIRAAFAYAPTYDDFFCHNLCNYRETCPHAKPKK